MNTNFYNQMRDVLDKDENILWEGKPSFIPFIASGLPLFGFGLMWALIDFSFIIQGLLKSPVNMEIAIIIIPFFFFHLFPFWIAVFNFARLFLVFKNSHYATTNKRVLLRTGFLGIDFKSIAYDRIADVRVSVNPIENIFGVGSIKINTELIDGSSSIENDSITAIANPYEVFKQIKTDAVNVKTDWNYPNKLRPSENPGYQT